MTASHRPADDLHDALSQTLFAAHLMAGNLVRQAERGATVDAAALAREARALERLNRGALAELRMLRFALHPETLGDQRLAELLRPAIEALACRGDIVVEVALADDDLLSRATRAQLYRIATELLANLARHSAARHAWIRWQPDAPEGPTLSVRDDGQGFDPHAARPGRLGLDQVQARAAAIGARLQLASAPAAGTEARITLPAKPGPNA